LRRFRLFGTAGCHLCEQARALLVEAQVRCGGFAFEEVDISESDVLFARYGVRIPVVLHPDQRELGWPFSETQLQDFLAS